MRTCSIAPALALETEAVIRALLSFGMIIPCTPKASAERISVPMFCGSSIESSISMKAFSSVACHASIRSSSSYCGQFPRALRRLSPDGFLSLRGYPGFAASTGSTRMPLSRAALISSLMELPLALPERFEEMNRRSNLAPERMASLTGFMPYMIRFSNLKAPSMGLRSYQQRRVTCLFPGLHYSLIGEYLRADQSGVGDQCAGIIVKAYGDNIVPFGLLFRPKV